MSRGEKGKKPRDKGKDFKPQEHKRPIIRQCFGTPPLKMFVSIKGDGFLGAPIGVVWDKHLQI